MAVAGSRLGIDLGTSAVKVVLLGGNGAVLAEGEATYPTRSEHPGQAEQTPEDWLKATGRAVGELTKSVGSGWSEHLTAIGLAGQLPTLVCLGTEDAIGPAITWQDGRADAWADTVLQGHDRAAIYRATGMPLDGRYLAPQFRFHRGDDAADIRRIVSAKDYLIYALTGREVTDPSTAAGYGVYALAQGDWDPELCALWKLSPSLLPSISPSSCVCGALRPDAAAAIGLPAGLPVCCGAADSVAGAFAMTGLRADTASVAMGSSTIVMAATQEVVLDPQARYLLTPSAAAGWFGREMDLLSTGTGFAWLAKILGLTPRELERCALESPPGAAGLACAPYFGGGEQGAIWEPDLAGVFHGLTTATRVDHLARAYLEGVFFEVRRCLDVLSETKPVRQIVLSGRAATNPALVQMLADTTGRSVRAFGYGSPSAIGAAAIGADDPDALLGAVRHSGPEAVPAEPADTYVRLYARHLDLFPKIARPSDAGHERHR